MKSVMLTLVLAASSFLSTFAAQSAQGDSFSFEVNQLYNSEFSAWGNEVALDYRLFSDSKWRVQVAADYFDAYHQEQFTPELKHAYANIRAGFGYRWQPSYLFSVQAELGAAAAAIDVSELQVSAGDAQGYVSLLAGYKIHSKIELQTGVNYDFGVGDLEASPSFVLGLRFTPGAKTKTRKKRKTNEQPNLNDLNKDFGWPNVKVKQAMGSGKKQIKATSAEVKSQTVPAKEQTVAESKRKMAESSLTKPMQADAALATEVMLEESKPVEKIHSFEELLQARPQLKDLTQVYSIQLGTFADPNSIPHFLAKHKFTLDDVFMKLSGRYQKLFTGLYAERESAQQVLELLKESGLQALVVSLPIN